jgi:hypothetical protein
MFFDQGNLHKRSHNRSRVHNAQTADQIRQNMESVTTRGFLADEAAEADRQENERIAAVRTVESELNRNFSELHKAERENAFSPAFLGIDGQHHHYEDPHTVYDADAPTVFYSEAELNAYNREQVRLFMAECPDFFPDNEGLNRDTIFRYLKAHGKETIVSAKMLHNVFERLTYLGLLIQRPAAVTTPAPTHVAPAAPVKTVWNINDVYTGKSTADLFEGWDPHGSGQRVRLTARQIDKLSFDQYKMFSRATVQEKPDYARIEDREPDFMAAQFNNRGRGR